MRRNIIETILGAVVLVVAISFVVYSYKQADIGAGSGGYQISANFSGIGGLKPGDDVQISGVKIGTVSNVSLNPETFLARVDMMVDDGVKLPVDTAALISSESLLGGRYLALEPGADEELLAPGGVIEFTQAPQNLEQLLGQFIFSATQDKDEDGADEGEEEGMAEDGGADESTAAVEGEPSVETQPTLPTAAPNAPEPAVETPAPAAAAETAPSQPAVEPVPAPVPEAPAPAAAAPAPAAP